MRAKVFIFWIASLALISLISLIFILSNIDPYNASVLNFVLFYLSFFITIAGLFILLEFYLRKLIIKNRIQFKLLKASFRQGILISIILTSFLLLQSFKILNLLTGAIIILLTIIFEIYFRRK